jgi:polyhydroxyalkanoate synthase
MIGYLLGEGFDTFLLDWDPADPADAENTLETYVDGYIPEAIGALLEEARAEEVTLIVCRSESHRSRSDRTAVL